MFQKVHSFAPATVANVACGFDVFGFAVEQPGDEVMIEKSSQPGVRIKNILGDGGKLSWEAEKNTASVAVIEFLKYLGSHQGLSITLHKKMPLGSGMGSSAASSVAALLAANELLGLPLERKELLPFAMKAEGEACGAAHADNVAPALYGGFVLIRSYDPLDVISIPAPPELFCTLLHMDIEICTKDARDMLPQEVSLKKAISQWGNTAGLVAGLMGEDLELVGRSLQDVIVEPVRAQLIPGFYDIKQAALRAGAIGCSISGSGPSIFALSGSKEAADQIGKAMQGTAGLKSQVYTSPINSEGAKILSRQ